MGRRKKKVYLRRKRSIFSRPHPIKRKMQLRRRRIKAFLHKYDPRVRIVMGVRKIVDGIYTTPGKHIVKGVRKVAGEIYKVKDTISDNIMALDNPFSAQFYKDRCNIQ